jgi:hypothetical protein
MSYADPAPEPDGHLLFISRAAEVSTCLLA